MSGPHPRVLPRSSRIALRCSRDGQHVLEQILDLEDLVGDVAQHLLEAPVLLPGAVAVEDVVEEKLPPSSPGTIRSISGPGQVDEDRLQLSDLGGNSQAHADSRGERGILQEPDRIRRRGSNPLREGHFFRG